MARAKTVYVCAECGAQHPKWMGRCGDCGAWNSLEETVSVASSPTPLRVGDDRGGGYAGVGDARVQVLAEVEARAESRLASGIGELDQVLGGGWWWVRWCSSAATRGLANPPFCSRP